MSTLNENPKWILEGALLTSDVPLSVSTLRECLDKRFTKAQVLQMLAELQDDWQGRALELREVAEGLWRFQSGFGDARDTAKAPSGRSAEIQPYRDGNIGGDCLSSARNARRH